MAVDDPEKYKDKEPFIQAAADSFLSPDTDTASHDIQHLSDFLEELIKMNSLPERYRDECAWDANLDIRRMIRKLKG